MGNSRSSSTSLHHTKEHLEPQILHSYQSDYNIFFIIGSLTQYNEITRINELSNRYCKDEMDITIDQRNENKIIMRTVWRHMAQGGHASSGATVLKRLIIKEPKIKNVFHHTAVISRMGKSNRSDSDSQARPCSLNDHQVQIVRFMQFVMANLDSPSLISIECTRIGHCHRRIRQFGLKAEYWDLLGESLTETIREYQGWRRHRESLRAANLLISFLVDRIRAGFIQRHSQVSLAPPRPILKSSPSRNEDLNGNISRNSSSKRKESVRFNKNRKGVAEMDDGDGLDGRDYGRARNGMRRETSYPMIRSRSEMGRIEWIDNEDDEDDDEIDESSNRYERRREDDHDNLNKKMRSSSERRHPSTNNRDRQIIYRTPLPNYSTPSRTPPSRMLPRTPTIDFQSYASPPEYPTHHSSTAPSLHKRSLIRYHSLDPGYHSASSPSDGEHSLHRPSHPSHPLPLSTMIHHSPSSSYPLYNSIHNVLHSPSHPLNSPSISYSSHPIPNNRG